MSSAPPPVSETDTAPSSFPPPGPPPADPAEPNRRRTPFDLSATQLVATGLAATTATIAASFLGVTGTVIGAALASVLTAIGNAVYGSSLRRGRETVRNAVPVLARTSALPTVGGPHPVPGAMPGPDEPPELPASRPSPRPRPYRRGARRDEGTPDTGDLVSARALAKRIMVGAVGIFVVVMAVITAVEAIGGRPVSDLVRDKSGGGTSFFGDAQVRTVTVRPTMTVTVTPSVTFTTPVVTQTAPPVTRTNTPSGTVSDTPSGTASDSPSATTSGSAASSSASRATASRTTRP